MTKQRGSIGRLIHDCAVRFPLLTCFLGGLVIVGGCAYVGYCAAASITYRYKQAAWFSALDAKDREEMRESGRSLLAYTLSCLTIQNSEPSFDAGTKNLTRIRSGAPERLWPVFNLRIAKNYAAVARLEERSNAAASTRNRQQAESLLRSLGWQDVSGDLLAALADKELQTRVKR